MASAVQFGRNAVWPVSDLPLAARIPWVSGGLRERVAVRVLFVCSRICFYEPFGSTRVRSLRALRQCFFFVLPWCSLCKRTARLRLRTTVDLQKDAWFS